MKNQGLKKSLILLSILPYKYRKNIFSHLSIFEFRKLSNFAEEHGGFEQLKNNINQKSKELVLNNFFESLKEKKNFLFGDLITGIIFLSLGLLLLLTNLFIISFQDFIYQFINLGYSAIFTPVLVIFLTLKNRFSWKYNFTNSRIFIRQIFEAIFSSILLIIILFELNAISKIPINVKPDIFSLVYGTLFIPFFEELLFRYILMGLFLNKTNRLIKILVSAFLFSIAHLSFDSFLSSFLYFLAGIILSILFTIENYIFPSFLAHGIANFFIILID